MSTLTESAVRHRARRFGMLLRKAPCGGYHVVQAASGASPFVRGYRHPRSLEDVAAIVGALQSLRSLVGHSKGHA